MDRSIPMSISGSNNSERAVMVLRMTLKLLRCKYPSDLFISRIYEFGHFICNCGPGPFWRNELFICLPFMLAIG